MTAPGWGNASNVRTGAGTVVRLQRLLLALLLHWTVAGMFVIQHLLRRIDDLTQEFGHRSLPAEVYLASERTEARFIILVFSVTWIAGALGIWLAGRNLSRHLAEREATDRALRESEDKYRTLVERALDGIIIIQDGIVTYANQRMADLNGSTLAELVGTPYLDHVFPSEVQRLTETYRRRVAGEPVPHTYETVLRRKDGAAVPAELSAALITYRGRPADLVIVRDTTERKHAEQVIQESEERYRALFEAESDAIVLIDNATGRILEANSAVDQLYGYEHDELLTLRNTDLSAEPAQTERVTKETPVCPDRIVAIPLRHHRRKDGTVFPVEITGRFFTLRGRALHLAAIRDITERIASQHALETSERNYRLLYHQMLDGYVRVAMDGPILECNEAYAALTGYSREELSHLSYIDLTPESWREMERKIVEEEILPRGSSRLYEKEYRRKDGSLVPIELLVHLERDAGGAPASMSAVVRDISARKKTEEELRRSNADLAQFATVVSHDLQEPLRMVASYTTLLEQRYGDRLDDDGRTFIRFAVDGARRLHRLIEDLLTFSRLSTRGQAFEPVPLDEVVAAARENLSLAIAESDARIEAETLPTVLGDRSQLIQLFQNLIANAVKFHAPGVQPRIEIGTRNLAQDGGIFTFFVRDNGIGIDPKHFDRIFVIFQRLHGEDAFPGTGLGLAVCKKIAERHGGTIRVESEPGKGTTFILSLPDGAQA
jgi:PAS domain S-box-containing protein